MSSLAHAHRGPLTWWLFEPREQLAVTCSKGHRSFVQHHVLADGTLRAPSGQMSSMHCGVCNEDLPLSLADWPIGTTWTGPLPDPPPPPENECVGCGTRSRYLTGWGMCGRYVGIVCPQCFADAVKPAK